MSAGEFEVEPWGYAVDDAVYQGRRVWHVVSPGATGSGVLYHPTKVEDVLADDNVWERHVYEWVPHSEPCAYPQCKGTVAAIDDDANRGAL